MDAIASWLQLVRGGEWGRWTWDVKVEVGAELTQRDLCEDSPLVLGVDIGSHVRRDEAGCYCIAGDATPRKLPGHCLGEPNDSRLQKCVESDELRTHSLPALLCLHLVWRP